MREAIFTCALMSLVSSGLAAQNPQTRQGFGISFGLGGGSASISCDGCESERETALSGYLRLGGYASPSLFIGGESNGWTKSEGGIDELIGFLSAVAQWYPQVTNGFYLKGGVGFATSEASDDVDELTIGGVGLTVGAGYDWRLTRNFSLTPYLNYLRSFTGELEFNGTSSGVSANIDVVQFGLGFTWH
jgi:hypothetical protein